MSGAYMVRESDAHAWAEVYFADQGWVPVDSAPRPDITLLFNTDAGVGYLFGGGFGEEAYQTVKATPSKIADLLSQGLDVQGLAGILSVGSLIIIVALGWRRFRWVGPNRPSKLGWCLPYAPLPGPGRREFLRLYAAAEKLLQRSGNGQRLARQTVGGYSALATAVTPEAKSHLDWFTNGAWRAAYDPPALPLPVGGGGKAQAAGTQGSATGRERLKPKLRWDPRKPKPRWILHRHRIGQRFQHRHSGERRNPASSTHQPGGGIWAPAFAGATNTPPRGPLPALYHF